MKFQDFSPTQEAQRPTSTAIVVNADTNTFEFVMRPKGRVETSDVLSLEDLRELRKTGLNNRLYFEQAKRVFAAGGGAKDIRKACGLSPSAAKKVLAALNRAKKVQVQKSVQKINNL